MYDNSQLEMVESNVEKYSEEDVKNVSKRLAELSKTLPEKQEELLRLVLGTGQWVGTVEDSLELEEDVYEVALSALKTFTGSGRDKRKDGKHHWKRTTAR